MKRPPVLTFLIALVFLFGWAGRDAVSQNPFKSPALIALTQRYTVPKDHKTVPFRETLRVASTISGVKIAIDPRSLKGGQRLEDIEGQAVRLPKLNAVSFAALLRYLTRQVGASYLIRGNDIAVVLDNPGANFATSPTPVGQQLEAILKKQLTTKISVKKAENVTFDDAVYDLAYKYKLNVLVDTSDFARAGKKDVLSAPVSVADAKNVPLSTALQNLAKQVRGNYRVGDNIIWIEPAGK